MTGGLHLCMHLDERGFPCNRRTMRPLSMCDQHREKVRYDKPQDPERRREYARRYRAAKRRERDAAGVLA